MTQPSPIPLHGTSDYLGLVLYKTRADLKAESERTYVGYLWWVVEPVLSMVVYYIVFELVLHRGTENFVTFLFVGLVPWRWLSTTLMHGANSIINSQALMRQVYLPKVVFPLVSCLSDTVKFLVVFAVLVLYVALSGFPVTAAYLALPVVVLVQALLVAAVTLLAAGVTPFLPDVRMVLQNVVRLWLFLSGVFYAVETLSPRAQFYFRMNPMTVVIESYREVLMYGRWPDLPWLGWIAGGSLLGVWAGTALIRRYDYLYPKLVL